MTLTGQIAVFLGATVLTVPLFRRLRLSSILAHLAAGVLIGPFGLAVINDTEGVMHIAEFGVVLLLFVIGLELQPSRLRAMRRSIFGLGLAQVAVTTCAITAVAHLLGLPMNAAFVVGFALSLSSTPLVLQLLAERHELNTQHGRPAFAVLLFQDLAVMPVLAILPLLGATAAAENNLGETLLGAAKGLGVLALLVFGGRFIVNPVLRVVAETKVSETFTAAALLIVIGNALLVNAVGMSMALGAFIAGVLLAESEYRHELEADIEPFKGLLLGLFFMSVGMTTNIRLLLEQPALIAALVAGLALLKALLLYGVARAFGMQIQHASPLAVTLAQGGEFGFVLFSLAVSHQIMPASLAQLLVIVVTISMAMTPLVIKLHATFVEPSLAKTEARDFDDIPDTGSRVLIAGFGRVGQIIGRVLRMRRISFTALESSVSQVDFVRRFGNKVYYGDPSRLELLQAAGAARAEIFVLAMDDVDASVRTAALIKKHFPHLKVFARARNRRHAIKLMEQGVRYFVRETYYSSLDMAQNTLEALGLSRAEALESIRRFDEHDKRMLEQQRLAGDDEQKLIQSAQQAARELEGLFEEDVKREVTGEPVAVGENR
jgi:glutathione-regulated potassium-efflux system ancillary protein KefC/glutathione-regulated potassium-efflux system protein KefB